MTYLTSSESNQRKNNKMEENNSTNQQQQQQQQQQQLYADLLCIELNKGSETHLFRHASEITKETKGGYLNGRILIPESNKPCYLRISLAPAEPDQVNNEFNLHPNLLHINMRQNKKNRNLQVLTKVECSGKSLMVCCKI
jgi:hypothetical protein